MPNSILWIGLVVLWVFVLFPIMADRHPRIRRTTDAALATRVLHRGGAERRIRIGAAGDHETDPDYRPRVLSKRPHRTDSEDRMTTDEPVTEDDDEKTTAVAELEAAAPGPDTDSAERPDETADLADPDTEDDAPEQVSAAAEDDASMSARIPPAPPARLEDVEPVEESGAALDEDDDFVPSRRGRGGYDPEADAIARAARYSFRQRAVLGLIIAVILFAAFGLLLNSMFWWACGLSAAVLTGYLAYLRKQVHVEEEIRRRRAARLTRGKRREDAEVTPEAATTRRTMDRDTARALRRRSTLLDTDDEDPMFEYLEAFDPATSRALRHRVEDLGRAVGE
ncbi:gephyrin-like molybdotransferase receptor GlpR [Nocardia sp. AG03]|uniref:divisome protein SepX/GlpR n=1 Tax=Nocardia sp. AG03 TaxID=3025312 RepID=UPI0024183ABE|nr:gephyrin-like molybdotransferase receptor GlpR [Nocardia sp. AG03]